MRLTNSFVCNQPNFGKLMSNSIVYMKICFKTINLQLISGYPLKKKSMQIINLE